jgi:hypothetical protein
MLKKTNISVIVGVVAIMAVLTIAGGAAYSGGLEQVVNNFSGETVVNQNVQNEQCPDVDMGIADQSGGFVITKTVTNSDIATSSTDMYAGLDITNNVSGSLVLDEMIVTANGTSIAGCTAIKVIASGNSASTTVMQINAIASIAANETIDFKNADTAYKVLLKDGSKLQVLPTGDVCTGAGELTFTMFFKKVDERSHIYD